MGSLLPYWFAHVQEDHCMEKELHHDNMGELPDKKDVLFQPLSLMELSRVGCFETP